MPNVLLSIIIFRKIFLCRISEENDSVYISITKVPHQIKAYRCHCKISLPHRFVISIAGDFRFSFFSICHVQPLLLDLLLVSREENKSDKVVDYLYTISRLEIG